MSNSKFDWQPIPAEQTDYLYSTLDIAVDRERRCIGHLRGDFGHKGLEFWTTWFPHGNDLQTPAFNAELDDVVNALRVKGGLLENMKSMEAACVRLNGTHAKGWMPTYGFVMETELHRYCLRCVPTCGEYNFYLYCYAKEEREKEQAVKGRRKGAAVRKAGDER